MKLIPVGDVGGFDPLTLQQDRAYPTSCKLLDMKPLDMVDVYKEMIL